MNRRPTLLAAAAFTAAAVLSLSACGGGDGESKDNEKNEKIAGADTDSGGERRTPSPKTSEDDGIDRPRIRLPKDVKNVFEGGVTGDPEKDAVLADNKRWVDSLIEAVTVDAQDHPALKFYATGDALVSSAEYIQGFRDKNKSFVGTIRYYDRKVTFLKEGVAAVTYCKDGTKTYPKDLKTGKVDRSIEGSASDYAFVNTRVTKNGKGVWQTDSITSTTGSKKCVP
ncbi:hypothetical protein JQK87_23940 [Streptomyces sp. G44]|uniref:hypothetical protein n=1 Tax=Streptomyces sp. G44 TaxID=2807632 RepID=UPI001961B5B5|nr:hypothetical protein [Streptomyces sp. G44]MBM7171401.1 hypothetical protein [Streptomyces sp. G44]